MQQRRRRRVRRTGVAWLVLAIVVALIGVGVVLRTGRVGEQGNLPGVGDTSFAPATSGGTIAASSPGDRASASAGPAPSGAAASVLPEPSDVVLVGAGDIATCASERDDETGKLVARTPGIVFTLGDNAYETGSDESFRSCYEPAWGGVKDRTKLATAGNHDYGTRDAAGLRRYFGDAAVRDGVTWFSEDVGAWHVVVLDANCGQIRGGCGADSPEVRWLHKDLAASTAACTLALWHQPRFSSGYHGNDRAVAPFWDALYAADADLVLNGHDHDYERFAPQDPAGRADPERGITEIVVGTGGAELRGFDSAVANSLVRSSRSHGVIVLTLSATGWSSRFIATDTDFADRASGRCH